MKQRKKDTRWAISVALMAAVVVVLANTPLGMIQLPVIKATTVHIPVILGAALLGPVAGGILGAVFGICSLISNTTTPTLLSFAFSPFMSTTGILGALKALWISVGCRAVMGIVAAWLWMVFHWLGARLKLDSIVAYVVTGFTASMFHTMIVMGSIYFLLAQQYATAKSVAVTAVWGLIMTTIVGSGVPEAIAAAVLVGALGRVLSRVLKQGT